MRFSRLSALLGALAIAHARSSSPEPELQTRADTNCTVNPTGSGPVSDPDTVYGFRHNDELTSTANRAVTPNGYSQTFVNYNASTSSASTFLGTSALTSYNTTECASQCTTKDGCVAFNIFFERDPATSCPNNGSSTTNIKCALWAGPATSENTNNQGYTDGNGFTIAIAGSNGYVQGEIKNSTGGNKGDAGIVGVNWTWTIMPLFMTALIYAL